jgi:hypothetical protein
MAAKANRLRRVTRVREEYTMLSETPSASTKIVTALKVAALVTVLGTVVLAAEQRFAAAVSHEQTTFAETATAHHAPALDGTAQQAATEYFPARFPAPTGEPAEPMPTF